MANSRLRTVPKEIYFDGKMNIIWRDGAHTVHDYWELRTSCPCAGCVSEITGEKILDDSTVDKGIHPLRSAYVGNYALQIFWSDNHNTGIYSFSSLRDSGEEVPKSVS